MTARSCYFPDGVSTGFVPCNPEATDSACCATGESCIGSGLCYSSNGGIYRGSCTDKHWNADECANICLKTDGTWNAGRQSGSSFLVQCSDVGGSDPQWACVDGYGNVNCTNAPDLRLGPILQVNITGTSTPVSSASSATTVRITTTVRPTNTATSNATTVGFAVGVSLGCLLLIATAAAIWYSRKWLALKKEMAQYYPLPNVAPQYEQYPSKVEGAVVPERYTPIAQHELSGDVRRAELGGQND